MEYGIALHRDNTIGFCFLREFNNQGNFSRVSAISAIATVTNLLLLRKTLSNTEKFLFFPHSSDNQLLPKLHFAYVRPT